MLYYLAKEYVLKKEMYIFHSKYYINPFWGEWLGIQGQKIGSFKEYFLNVST